MGRRGTWPRNLGATPFFQTQLKHRHPYLPEEDRINAALDAAGVLCRRRGVWTRLPRFLQRPGGHNVQVCRARGRGPRLSTLPLA